MDRTATSFWTPLIVLVMVGVPTPTTTTTITMHPAMASAIGMALVATGALLNASAPLLTGATPAAYSRPAYLPYAGHALQAKPASACAIHEAVGQ